MATDEAVYKQLLSTAPSTCVRALTLSTAALPHRVDPSKLQGKKLEAYKIVLACHHNHKKQEALKLIVSGTAGTRESYLISCLQKLLSDHLRVTAPTGAATYNVHDCTLHSLLNILIRGDFRDLEGLHLHDFQQSLAGVHYIIIDEMSMISRKLFGQVDRILCQAFPHQ